MTIFRFEPVFESYLLVAAIAVILLGLLLLRSRSATEQLTSRRRRLLVALRVLVIAIAVTAMLQPTWISSKVIQRKATLLVLMDRSRSMLVPDADGGRSRWDALKSAIQNLLPGLDQIKDQLEVKFHLFDSSTESITPSNNEFLWPKLPEGIQTDLGGVLTDALRSEAGKRIAGVVLLSDGATRAYTPRIELRQAAREVKREGCPLYTVTFGQPRDPSQSRDVAIESLPDHYTVFVNNELEIQAQIRLQGYVNREVPLELIIEDQDGVIDRQGPFTISTTDDLQTVPFTTNYLPQQTGRFKLTLKAAQLPGELVTRNNELTSFLTVREGGLRIAYLWALGDVSPNEPRLLRRAINNAPDMNLDDKTILHGFQDHWPVNLDEFFEPPGYDVFILHSVHAEALGTHNLTRLAEAVESGKGLLMLGGIYSFGPGGYAKTEFKHLLPVQLDRLSRQDLSQPVRSELHLTNRKMIPTTDHLVTRLTTSDNLAVWRQLPAMPFINRFHGIKPQALLLAESEQGDPILVTHRFQQGRVMAMAADSTWRWHTKGFTDIHLQFWRQIIFWLAQRDQPQQGEVWIHLNQRRHSPKSRVLFTTGASTSLGSSVPTKQLRATLILPDGNRKNLKLSQDGEHTRGRFTAPEEPGNYSLEVLAQTDTEPIGTARETFVILDRDLELSDPAADPELMASLAGMTSESGGRVVAPEELSSLLNEIVENLSQYQVEVQTRRQLADTMENSLVVLIGIVVLLSFEWLLRKRWGMV